MQQRLARLVAVVLFGACGLPWRLHAEEIEPLDADFLEYLAGFGSDEENWVLFTDDASAGQAERKTEPARKDEAKRNECKTEAAAKPADKR